MVFPDKMAQMNGIAPAGAGKGWDGAGWDGAGWDGAAGLETPFPCYPQLLCFLFLIYLVLRRSGMKLKPLAEDTLLLPAVPLL